MKRPFAEEPREILRERRVHGRRACTKMRRSSVVRSLRLGLGTQPPWCRARRPRLARGRERNDAAIARERHDRVRSHLSPPAPPTRSSRLTRGPRRPFPKCARLNECMKCARSTRTRASRGASRTHSPRTMIHPSRARSGSGVRAPWCAVARTSDGNERGRALCFSPDVGETTSPEARTTHLDITRRNLASYLG